MSLLQVSTHSEEVQPLWVMVGGAALMPLSLDTS